MKANEQLIRDTFRAVEERDLDRLLEIYAPDVEFVWPPSLPGYGGTYSGAEVADMNLAFAAAWDPVQPTEEDRRIPARIVASSDDEVVVHYHQRGVAPDGRRCDSEVIGVYTVAGDKVTRLQMFYFEPEEVAAFLRHTARLAS